MKQQDIEELEEFENNIFQEILTLPKVKIHGEYFDTEEAKQILDFN